MSGAYVSSAMDTDDLSYTHTPIGSHSMVVDLPRVITIHELPTDVCFLIASHLEGVWLFNFARLHPILWRMFSFENANHIWYKTLPPSTWAEAEEYQDEVELEELAFKLHYQRGGLTPKLNQWLTFLYLEDQQFRANYPTAVPMMTEHHMNEQWYLVEQERIFAASLPRDQDDFDDQYHTGHVIAEYPGGMTLEENQDFHTRQDALEERIHALLRKSPSTRPRNNALGGPYNELTNYKREVLGRLSRAYFETRNAPPDVRCQLCLRRRIIAFNMDATLRFGVMWCDDCLEDYTMTHELALCIFSLGELQLHAPKMLRNRKGRWVYWRPALDKILLRRGWVNFSLIGRVIQPLQLEIPPASQLEEYRRDFRLRIVEAAKLMWDGIDPCPVLSFGEDGSVIETSNPRYTDTTNYTVFKKTFCSAHSLELVLFPSSELSRREPTSSTRPGKGWLEDPATVVVRRNNMRQRPSTQVVAYYAHRMLSKLTDFTHPLYNYRDKGGAVGAWVDLAKDYHKHRINQQLDSGEIVRMTNVPIHDLNSTTYDNLHRLREGLGLGQQGRYLEPVQERLNYHEHAGADNVTLMQRDAEIIATHRDHLQRIAAFNRILSVDCHNCPTGSGSFFPNGLDGLLSHMAEAHPIQFFGAKDWTICG